jgi:uncharacterized membrane protein YebE (DUF533 family)
MDAQQILDSLLKSGQELVQQGKSLAEKRLQLPDDPAKRDAMLDGASKGALAASALAVLLGTNAGRKLTGATLKLGSLAAIGGIAYKTFQDWQNSQNQPQVAAGQPVSELTGNDLSQRSKILLKAMIAAAKADGHIDDKERELLTGQIGKLDAGSDATALINAELDKPVSVQEIAAGADSPAAAAEIYLLSRMVIDANNEQERAYLAQLAQALKLAPDLVAQLDQQATSG